MMGTVPQAWSPFFVGSVIHIPNMPGGGDSQHARGRIGAYERRYFK